MIQIAISLPGDRFTARESMVLTVTVTNAGTAAIDVPDPGDARNGQPVYAIRGPSYPDGHRFRLGRGEAAAEAVRIRLGPGESCEAELPLEMMAPCKEAGAYSLKAVYEGAASGTLTFAIGEPALRAARIMADDGMQRPDIQRVLALVGDPPKLYQFLFREQRPGIGEIKFAKMVAAPVADVPADAMDVVAPWTNFDRSDVFFFRTGWRSAGEIGIETDSAEQTSRMKVEAGAEAVHPALMAMDGAAHLFLRTRSEIRLMRFPLPGDGEPGSPAEVVWKAALAERADGACAAMSPAGVCRALTVAAVEGGVELTLQGPDLGGGAAVFFEGARLLPQSQPAMWIGEDGQPRAAVLLGDGGAGVFAGRVDWSAASEEAVTRQPAVAALPGAAAACAAAFAITPGRPPARLDWVILLENGRFLTSTAAVTPQIVASKPVLPLQLLSMSKAMYLLTADESDILKFRNLH